MLCRADTAVRPAKYTAGEAGRKANAMRLDKYLKVSRLIKRRTVANAVSYTHLTLPTNSLV